MPSMRHTFRPLRRPLAILALWLGAVAAGQAQAPSPEPSQSPLPTQASVPSQSHLPSAACLRYRSELASLGNGASMVRALQSEIGRLEAYHRSLSCEGGTFLFFDTRPPQCGAVEQRIRALNATYGGAAIDDSGARRRQLQGLIAASCADTARVDPATGEAYARGGAQVICVRTCDGAYFPMRNLPEGRNGADEMCQALCPGTEAAAYSMPYGDEALKSAATVKGGKAYVSLANAFKFRKTFVPNCSCKPADRTWAQSLVKAESMLVRHKGDIFVTPMQAEALSRPAPKVRLTLVGRADKTAAVLAADAAERSGLPVEMAPKPAPDLSTEPSTTGTAERTVRVIALDRLVPAKAPAP
ncbi:DUF2865 domain-containing protein [Methylobacterium sp. WL6]|uniref:DUF2865 domain-containing protein n=1 Tax=Methylobacterium sp. WL6 TaxID=2603901 RepID=UPI001FF01A2F|nr:DUF2865 domain-containing protein [Methylobacterium sp. WL6]